MNDTRLNGTLLNRSVLNSTRLNATGIARKAKESVEDRVMKSLVLWYDLKKQGATNESMAADPRVIDHSGNGHHATCYNFAWAGMSGIGGYVANYLTFVEFLTDKSTQQLRGTGSVSGEKITITSANVTYNLIESDGLPAHKVRVTGLTGTGITLMYGAANAGLASMTADGEYELPDHQGDTFIGYSLAEAVESCNIVIEQLPLYPNALVSDGVDDYAETMGLPLFTKDKGYAIIVDREIFVLNKNSAIACKRFQSRSDDQSFTFERDRENRKICTSFGSVNYLDDDDIDFARQVTFQTSVNYNGKKIYVGSYKDADAFYLYRQTNAGAVASAAIYSILLFDRDLTAEEIEWVKTNMIGGNE